jgi:hypothetical protein
MLKKGHALLVNQTCDIGHFVSIVRTVKLQCSVQIAFSHAMHGAIISQ